ECNSPYYVIWNLTPNEERTSSRSTAEEPLLGSRQTSYQTGSFQQKSQQDPKNVEGTICSSVCAVL
ncbi:hypothetical protein, partial [Bacillus halotolerans]|uniref:hypothetical protein n=1 Tax=Bacillus halotolerans TaxID=260554 RepID=UPI001C636B5C